MVPTDSDLMQRLADGDDLSLSVLMERWSERVVSFLYRMTGDRDAALDLAQETFVKLYQARYRYQATGQFSTYLFTIASNLARNYARWRRRHPTLSLDETVQAEEGQSFAATLPDPGRTPVETLNLSEQMTAVEQAFALLPHDLREAMTLFIHEEMGYAEIATVLGCTPKAVETRIYRARNILREQFGK